MPIPNSTRMLLAGILLTVAAPLAAQGTPSLAPRTRGAETAPITVYEMSDFQCPYCRRFALNTFPELDRDYVAIGKVRWVFINYPLTMIHPNAAVAAEVAMCAAKTGKFWEVHDLLFRNQATWAPLTEPGAFFQRFARHLRLPAGVRERIRGRLEARLGVKWSDLDVPAIAARNASPLLVIHDAGDHDVPIEDGHAIAIAAGGTLVETQGLGHRAIMRDPEVVHATVTFLARHLTS